MTKQEYLATNFRIGFYPEFGENKVKENPETFSMEYKGETFDFEVYTSKHWISQEFATTVVVADGIDFSKKISSIRLFGSHSYEEQANAYREAILKYCKKHDFSISFVKGDSPIGWVEVNDTKKYPYPTFTAQVHTY